MAHDVAARGADVGRPRDRLVVFDTRPRAAAPVSVLSGDDRALYLACDAITEAGQLEPSRAARLPALVARGLRAQRRRRHLSSACDRRIPAVARGVQASAAAAGGRRRARSSARCRAFASPSRTPNGRGRGRQQGGQMAKKKVEERRSRAGRSRPARRRRVRARRRRAPASTRSDVPASRRHRRLAESSLRHDFPLAAVAGGG